MVMVAKSRSIKDGKGLSGIQGSVWDIGMCRKRREKEGGGGDRDRADPKKSEVTVEPREGAGGIGWETNPGNDSSRRSSERRSLEVGPRT